MRKSLLFMMIGLVALPSCTFPRKERWKVEINSDCKVWGITDPAHNIDWICQDIDSRANGTKVLWPSRAGHQEFYTIWTNLKDSEDQLVALTDREADDGHGAYWRMWTFWDSNQKAVFGQEANYQEREEHYNYINEHFTCTDTICVMTCLK